MVAGFSTCWLLRPAIRAQSFLGVILAMIIFPFLAGSIFGACLAIFGRSAAEVEDFVGSMESTFRAIVDAPFFVAETLPLTIPAAIVSVIVLRKCDPPENMREKNAKALG